jgi:methionyl-tRNA formyltransferase
LLQVPRCGWVNLHFSLLPAWRGAAPVQHAILAGDDVTGATTFRLTAGLDEGPVFGTVTEPIGAGDTAGDLLERLAESGAELLRHTLDGLERGELEAHEQPPDGVSRAPKLSVADAKIRWSEPALAVDRRIRACTPQPGAWTEHRGGRLGVLPFASTADTEAPSPLASAELHVTKKHVWVGTGSHAVLLNLVKPAGKRVMTAADWARGARLTSGDVLA